MTSLGWGMVKCWLASVFLGTRGVSGLEDSSRANSGTSRKFWHLLHQGCGILHSSMGHK